MTRPQKRSFSIKGHRTSISLETPFWDALNEIALAGNRSVAALVAEIDDARPPATGLSTAVRIFVLDHFRSRGDGVSARTATSEFGDAAANVTVDAPTVASAASSTDSVAGARARNAPSDADQ
ncbi:MAG: ribbon-helix-helix domain-containing protein [Hyphomicrobiaceae bacterium]|nr:ribbon-helix-helix domain-containing protein [Hyphomicrobiaceae bacterium]